MNKPFQISRRSFLRTCLATSTVTGLPLWFIERDLALAQAAPRRLGPNERPGIALVGCGPQGIVDAGNAKNFGDLIALCDVDANRLQSAARFLAHDGGAPALYHDFRKVLDRDDVHAIIQATPDHWHTLVNMSAVKAGKDVYGEKPLTLTVDEGQRLVKAVRAHRAVLQTGSQQRSDGHFRLACELVRNGRIGKLKQVSVFLPAGWRDGPFKTVPVPEGLNWDYWLGQAPNVDYVPQRCHFSFRFWLDYAGGAVTDWGAHHHDIARWAIGLDGPIEVEGRSLAKPISGGYTAFSEYEAKLTYANGVIQIVKATEDHSFAGWLFGKRRQCNGVKFEGTDGCIWVCRGDLQASDEEILTTPLPDNAVRLDISPDHMGDFFQCIRSRKDPICHVQIGHRSASVCHLVSIALLLGRPLRWEPAKELFVGEGAHQANSHLAREMRRPYDYTFGA
jgi:predicted dehydrogenase